MAKKAKWHTTWTVLPHGPLQRLEDNTYVVEAPLPGFPLKRRMTVVRLADGNLVVHSAIALDEAAMAALEAWGTMAYLIVPNTYHRLDAFIWRQRYPLMKVITGERSRPKVEEALSVNGGPELLPQGLGLRGEVLDGAKLSEMAFVIDHGGHGDRRTLLVNDAVFNVAHQPGGKGFVLRAIGSSGGLKITRIMRWFGIADQQAFRAHLLRLAEANTPVRLIMSHGDLIEGDVLARLRPILAS